jgi:penicillin-binding protein 1B
MKVSIIKKVFLVLLIIAAISLTCLGLYSFFLIKEFEESLSFDFQEISESVLEEIVLTQDSLVSKEDLAALFPFFSYAKDIDEESFGPWWKKKLDQSVFSQVLGYQNGTFYKVNKSLVIEVNKQNHCARPYCLQRRVGFADIPSSLWRGLIGTEDTRFLEHSGVDFIALTRAIVADVKALSFVQGGSTLTQQLIKNLFFTNEKKIIRKIKEFILAIYIESRFEKEKILQVYFNEVIWGSLGGVRIKGVASAALLYFDKKLEDINNYEASILSAMLKGPYYYHPLKFTERLKERTNLVYELLKENKFISKNDDESWSEDQWKAWTSHLAKKNDRSNIEAISRSLKSLSFFDTYLWHSSWKETLKSLRKRKHLENKDLALKVFVRDLRTCDDAFENCHDYFYYSKEERELELGVFSEKHQVGSILKPIIYQELFNSEKILPEDMVSMNPIILDLNSGKWSPTDSGRDSLPEEITIKYALQKSKNTPLIRAAESVGFDYLETILIDYFPDLQRPLKEYPAQLLGAIELSLSEVIGAYSKFIKKACDSGKMESMQMLSDPNETTLASFVDPVMMNLRFFAKTGTSNSAHDNWLVTFHQGHLYALWVGQEGPRDEKSLMVSGSSTSFRVFQNYLVRSARKLNSELCF